MIDETLKSGIKINEFFGDKAYFRKPILNVIKIMGTVWGDPQEVYNLGTHKIYEFF